MEQFPAQFSAAKIQHDVIQNRMKKIEQDIRILRKKIVKSFQHNVKYHSEVTHALLPDLTEEEQKGFYCMVKDELQQRGFTVRGKIAEGVLSLIIFSNVPRTNEMDRVLRQYSNTEESEVSTPRSARSNHSTASSHASGRVSGRVTPDSLPPTADPASRSSKGGSHRPQYHTISPQVLTRKKARSSSIPVLVKHPRLSRPTSSSLSRPTTPLTPTSCPLAPPSPTPLSTPLPPPSLPLPSLPPPSLPPPSLSTPPLSIDAAGTPPPPVLVGGIVSSEGVAPVSSTGGEPSQPAPSSALPVTPQQVNMAFILDRLKRASSQTKK